MESLNLGDQFLTDEHRLTRRGYRLPIKVNPLDCNMLGKTASPWPYPSLTSPAAAFRIAPTAC